MKLQEQIRKVLKEYLNESDPKVGTGKKPKGSDRRLYTDENPSDTVSVKFRTKQDIVDTLNKESFKSKSHARQSQIINLIHQRLRVALERAKDPEVKKRLRTAFEYIVSKKEQSKNKTQEMKEGELTEKCWAGYTQKGMKTMFGKRYPNCVKKTKTNEASNPAQQAAIAINMKKNGIEPKKETKEQTGASSSGSYEGNAFGSMIKREIHKINNSKLTEEQEVEFKEATEASSSGAFDVPAFGKTTKGGRKNPLKIDGPSSEYKGRAVKDKNFPKWGGPDSVFVKVKDKCKKFPYCNQGNTGALEFIKEDQEIKHAITETSKKFGIPYKEMEKIVLNEITKIFI